MKVLKQTEISAVSGGSYTMSLDLYVPNSVADPVFDLFQQVVNGQITDMGQFINGLYALGPAGNTIRVETVEFKEFN